MGTLRIEEKQPSMPFVWGYNNLYIKEEDDKSDNLLNPKGLYYTNLLRANKTKSITTENISSDKPFNWDILYWIKQLLSKSSIIEQDVVEFTNSIQNLLKPLVLEASHRISPETFYLQNVCSLSGIEAITYEDMSGTKYFTTILTERDLLIREKIYDIELKMIELYQNIQFEFSVISLRTPQDLGLLVKNKMILFHKNSIYAK